MIGYQNQLREAAVNYFADDKFAKRIVSVWRRDDDNFIMEVIEAGVHIHDGFGEWKIPVKNRYRVSRHEGTKSGKYLFIVLDAIDGTDVV